MLSRDRLLLASILCFVATGFGATAQPWIIQKKTPKQEICDGLKIDHTRECTQARHHCEGTKFCKNVLSFLEKSNCLEARKTEAGCTKKLNKCLANPGPRPSVNDYEQLVEHLMKTRCAKYEWSFGSCRIVDGDSGTRHCPGEDIQKKGVEYFSDPDFKCAHNIAAYRYYAPRCRDVIRKLSENDCFRDYETSSNGKSSYREGPTCAFILPGE
jgi:hypothetical protein